MLICTLFVGPLTVLSYEAYLMTMLIVEKTGQPYWPAWMKYLRSAVFDRITSDKWASIRNLVTVRMQKKCAQGIDD